MARPLCVSWDYCPLSTRLPIGLVCLLCISAAILYVSAVGLNASATATAALTSQQFSHLYLIALYVGVCVCVNPLSAVRIKPRLQQDIAGYKCIQVDTTDRN